MAATALSGAFIIRYFTPRPAMTASIIVRTSAAMAAVAGAGSDGTHQDGLAVEERPDRAQTVHDERGAAGDEIDDAVGQAHRGRHLDGSADGHDLGPDAEPGEGRLGRVGVTGGQPVSGQVLERSRRRVVGHGRLQATVAVAELDEDVEVGTTLDEQVRSGDAEIGHAVGHELDDVIGAHEQDVQREPVHPRRQGAGAVLEAEAGVVEQLQ